MGTYRHVRTSFAKGLSTRSKALRERLARYRKARTVSKLDRPTNPFRARSLGYKAKQAFSVVRVKVRRGKHARRKADLGRKPGKNRKFVNPGISMKRQAEGKAKKKFNNLELVGSYLVGEDGERAYYEVVMFDSRL